MGIKGSYFTRGCVFVDPSAFIKKENISPFLKSTSKKEVIQELLGFFIHHGEIEAENKDTLFSELLKRESKGSTGIGNQIAIPHCKTPLVNDLHVAIGISPSGIDFESIDRQKVKIFVLTLSSNAGSSRHLQFLAFIANLFKEATMREKVIGSKDIESLYKLLMAGKR